MILDDIAMACQIQVKVSQGFFTKDCQVAGRKTNQDTSWDRGQESFQPNTAFDLQKMKPSGNIFRTAAKG